ncbi:hypothetical protein ES705_40690 [subsurface metagenome]
MIEPDYGRIFGGNVHGWLGCVIYPVIVTTANLYLIKSNQSIDHIKASKQFSDSFKQVDAVLFCFATNNELREYIREQFLKHKRKLLQSQYFSKKTLQTKLDDLSFFYNIPVLIVRLTAFKKTMGMVLKEIHDYFAELRKLCKKK